MVIWTRLGILALLIPGVIIFLLTTFVPPSVPNDPDSVSETNRKATAVGFLAGAVVVWFVGRWLNRDSVDTPYDPQTGRANKEMISKPHSMFLMPMEYWAILWVILGVARFF